MSWRSSRSLGDDKPLITLSSGCTTAIAGQTSSNRSCAIPFEMIRWVVRRLISRRNSACVSGRFCRDSQQRDDRLDERVVFFDLLRGQLDRHARVGARRELVEHILADRAAPCSREPVAERVEVAHADDLAPAVGVDRVQGGTRRHLGSSAMSSTHSTIEASSSIRFSIGVPVSTRRYGGVRPLDRERGLRRPVLDPLRLVEHHQIGGPLPDDVEVSDQLLIVDDEDSRSTGPVPLLAFRWGAVDDGDGHVGKPGPFAGPLRLEAGRGDDQSAPDPPGAPEDVACRDRLRRLAQSHVVGEQQPSQGQEPLHAFALIGVEGSFQALDAPS